MNEPDGVAAVVVAGGSGARFGAKKQFLELAGRPLVVHAAATFAAVPAVARVVVVVPRADLERAAGLLGVRAAGGSTVSGDVPLTVVAGGARRQDSVRQGLEALGSDTPWALVHDAARPLVTVEAVEIFIDRMRQVGAAVIGHPATDSVKQASGELVDSNLPRERIWLVQTPQGGRVRRLLEALDHVDGLGQTVTDEASAFELLGDPVTLVEGPRANIKVTRPEDLDLAEFLLARRG